METIPISRIENIANSDIPIKYKDIAVAFLTALNDWPHNANDLYDFEIQLHKFIKRLPTKTNIDYFLKNISSASYAWEQESLYELLDVYKYYNADISIKYIIEDLVHAIGN